MLCEPLVASVPLQAPEALQDDALVELHVSVEAAPAPMLVGVALSATAGTGSGVVTWISSDAGWLLPPLPEHMSVNVVSVVSAPVVRLPLAASAPLQPPDATQDVAFADVHDSVADSLSFIVVAEAVSAAVGSAVTAVVPPHAESNEPVAMAQNANPNCMARA